MDSDIVKLLDTKEIAYYLKIRSKERLYSLMKEDSFPSFRIGRQWYVLEDDFVDWLKKRKKVSTIAYVINSRKKP